ncbi:hypothetical protein R1sor_025294 [Riccia sorocarpa]|uniref:DUF7792 domain-containing protein n=1 Tax=Riccia sorocarpa TaxID=122646 RepID=A0ABD3G9T7_9MARC
MVDVVQKSMNMIEALNDAQQDAKVFRNHCHDISACTNQLFPVVVSAQRNIQDLSKQPGVSEAFTKLNTNMEQALAVLRKCGTMGMIEKLADQGETKRILQSILADLQSTSREAVTLLSQLLKAKQTSDGSSPAS